MAITLIEQLAAGNALRLFITPPRAAVHWRVLRRTADVFTGPDDSGAVVVANLSDDNVLLDARALVNGTAYFYRPYFWTGAAYVAAPSVTATPLAYYEGDACDVVEIVRTRLAAGLAVELARGTLVAIEGDGIPVVTAPFMLAEQVRFPMVHVHLDSFGPAEHALGADVSGAFLDEEGWGRTEGFRARSTVTIGGVCRTADERNALRRSLIRILHANYPVFTDAGMDLIEFSFADSEQLEDKATSLFLTVGSFVCQHASFVIAGRAPDISDVVTHASYYGMEPPNGR